jgi:hypothetical protein
LRCPARPMRPEPGNLVPLRQNPAELARPLGVDVLGPARPIGPAQGTQALQLPAQVRGVAAYPFPGSRAVSQAGNVRRGSAGTGPGPREHAVSSLDKRSGPMYLNGMKHCVLLPRCSSALWRLLRKAHRPSRRSALWTRSGW